MDRQVCVALDVVVGLLERDLVVACRVVRAVEDDLVGRSGDLDEAVLHDLDRRDRVLPDVGVAGVDLEARNVELRAVVHRGDMRRSVRCHLDHRADDLEHFAQVGACVRDRREPVVDAHPRDREVDRVVDAAGCLIERVVCVLAGLGGPEDVRDQRSGRDVVVDPAEVLHGRIKAREVRPDQVEDVAAVLLPLPAGDVGQVEAHQQRVVLVDVDRIAEHRARLEVLRGRLPGARDELHRD